MLVDSFIRKGDILEDTFNPEDVLMCTICSTFPIDNGINATEIRESIIALFKSLPFMEYEMNLFQDAVVRLLYHLSFDIRVERDRISLNPIMENDYTCMYLHLLDIQSGDIIDRITVGF